MKPDKSLSPHVLAAALGLALAALAALALLLAWVSTRFQSFQGWASFLAALVLSAGLFLGVWFSLRTERLPRWLAGLVVGAVLLRLAAGALWYSVLPVWGYASPAEQGGYVMADASERDRTAWDLAQSEKPLLRAFEGSYHKADQYGGLLFLSAALYRTLGGALHQPLLMVVVTALFSSLAVLFAWAFARRAWGETAACLTAWGLALYPEAVLLGSSQMREAFLMTLAAAAFYGLLRYIQDRRPAGLVWMAVMLLLSLPFSPPVTALLFTMLAITALLGSPGLLNQGLFRSRWFRLLLIVIVLLAAVGIWSAWQRFIPEDGATDLISVVNFWVRKSADFQAHLTERASGWVQKIFDATPDWLHLPLLILYGVVQPLLPAALADITGAPIWRGIAIWRSLGWTLLLPLLIYAPLRSLGGNGSGAGSRRLARGLSLVTWLVILVASFRSGGDPWDNPRYRAIFTALQVALAAWVWVEHRRLPHPGLRRVIFGAGLVLAWFMPWYLRRYVYLPWPVEDLFKTIALGLASAALYWIWDWAGYRRE